MLLADHASCVNISGFKQIKFQRRDNIFNSAEKGWCCPHFQGSMKVIQVKFISDEGKLAEDAEDLGGPRREYFLSIKDVHDKTLHCVPRCMVKCTLRMYF